MTTRISNTQTPFNVRIVSAGRQMRFGIGGRVFLIDCLDEWSAVAIRKLFAGWFLRPLEYDQTAADSIMTLRCGAMPPAIPAGLESFDVADGGSCHTNGRVVYIQLDGSLIVIDEHSNRLDVWIRTEYDFGSWILAQVLSQAFCASMRRCGLFLLHSAGVLSPSKNDALLIVGASGTGKSTLTFQLAASGWGYLSDDSIILKETANGIQAQGLRKFFALKEDTIAAVQLDINDAPAAGTKFKKRVSPQDLFPDGFVETAGIASIVFPVIVDAHESRLERLSSFDVMTRLLKLCPWACYDKPTASAYLKVFGELARRVSAFDLFSGRDLLDDPGGAPRLMSQALAD